MLVNALLALLCVVVFITAILLFLRLRGLNSQFSALSQEQTELKERFRGVVDADAESQRVLAELETKKQRTLEEIETLRERGLQELETQRQRELTQLEAERTRLRTDIAHAQSNHNQILQDFEQRRQRAESELEAIGVRAREAQNQVAQDFQEQRRGREAEIFDLQLSISKLREELKPLDEEAHLQSFGFYKPRYNFASSASYQAALEDIRDKQKWMIKNKTAATCRVEWTVDGNRAAGRMQTERTLKLMLRAFNGVCDAAVGRVRYNNVNVMSERIIKAWGDINVLVVVQQSEIARAYLDLKLEELYLAHEYQEKLQEEKEEQRRIREQMRDEEIALRELEKARQEAEREETRYAEALRKANEEAERAVGEKHQKLLWKIEELHRRLDEAHTNKERVIARAQMTRSGHVYVISNIGSFGEQVYKIGMTRRLDPLDRVRELGDASVPFHFDIHAIIYSEDAPALENKLHRMFHHRRINLVNERKEFFRVTIEEIAEAVRQNHGEIEITLAAEAVEYRKTLAMSEENQASLVTDTSSRSELIQETHDRSVNAQAEQV